MLWLTELILNGSSRRQQPIGGLTAQGGWLGFRVDSLVALFVMNERTLVLLMCSCHLLIMLMMTCELRAVMHNNLSSSAQDTVVLKC